MKRISLVLFLLLLSACQVSVVRVSVNPFNPVLGPGETVRLSASINVAGPVNFSWSASQGSLSSTTGVQVDYTAPTNPGTYTVTVVADTPSVNGTARVTVADAITAGTNPTEAVRTNESLGIVERNVYRVTIPESVTQPLVYFELQTSDEMELALYDSSQNLIAISKSASGFSEGGFSRLGLSSEDVATQAIGTNVICRGPCIIIRNEPGTYYLTAEADFISTYNLFVFGDQYQDSAEPDDSACSSFGLKTAAIAINITGAIETLDDRDCIPLNDATTATVRSLAATTVTLKAQIVLNGNVLDTQTFGPGVDTYSFNFTSPANGLLIISGDDEAAPSGNSKYEVSVN